MWNFRVGKKATGDARSPFVYSIYEAYYNSDQSLWLTSAEPVNLKAFDEVLGEEDPEDNYDGLEVLRNDWIRMGGAFTRPVLDMDNLVYTSPEDVERNSEDCGEDE